MALPNLPFPTLITSKQLISGDLVNGLVALLTGTKTGIIALAGGVWSASNAQFSSAFNELTTVASPADSYNLPPAKSGLMICITNSGANAAQIFGALSTDTIQNGAATTVAGNVGVSIAVNNTVQFISTKDGVWKRFIAA